MHITQNVTDEFGWNFQWKFKFAQVWKKIEKFDFVVIQISIWIYDSIEEFVTIAR